VTVLSSVRIRLTLWYSGAMALILLLLASTTFLYLRRNAANRADAQMVELADAFVNTVGAELSEIRNPDGLDDGVQAAISEHRFRDVTFVVLDPHGHLIGMSERSSPDQRDAFSSQDDMLPVVTNLAGQSGRFHFVRIGRHLYRGYVRQFSFENHQATLVMLESFSHQIDFLRTLQRAFAVVIPLTILLVGAGAYLLTARSLSPVVTMSAEASRIGADNLESRLSASNPKDELGRLAITFNGLLDRLSASFDRQKRFVADASHELRTPVAILCGETEVALAKSGRSEQEYRDTLRILNDESRRLKRIVEDLFTLARADAGQYPLSYSDFYLDELAAECTKNVRTLASAKRIKVCCDSGGEAPIRADETLVRRMLLNLLDNAIKYTPAGGSISVSCHTKNDCYELRILDSGPGIPPELQSRIFERFFRADKARSRCEQDGGGAGLGLSIGSWIARAHGGRLELTKSDALGTTFTATLPQSPPPG